MSKRKGQELRGCTGKQRHATKAEATAHLIALYKSIAYRGTVYRCRFCGAFHVGRSHRKRRTV